MRMVEGEVFTRRYSLESGIVDPEAQGMMSQQGASMSRKGLHRIFTLKPFVIQGKNEWLAAGGSRASAGFSQP
jgi:hypothetical protein